MPDSNQLLFHQIDFFMFIQTELISHMYTYIRDIYDNKKRRKENFKAMSLKRKVIIDEVYYESIREAARILNLDPQTILNRCKNVKFTNYMFFEDSSESSK